MVCLVLHFHTCVPFTVYNRIPKCSAEVLSSVLSMRRLPCALQRKCVLDVLHVDMRYSAVCLEVNASESTMHIKKVSLSENTQKTKFCIGGLLKMGPEPLRKLSLYFP